MTPHPGDPGWESLLCPMVPPWGFLRKVRRLGFINRTGRRINSRGWLRYFYLGGMQSWQGSDTFYPSCSHGRGRSGSVQPNLIEQGGAQPGLPFPTLSAPPCSIRFFRLGTLNEANL